jgi:CNT family concentrative nucleoside transporter
MPLPIQSALGFAALLALAFLISENRRAVPWRTVAGGAALQVVLALLLLKVPVFRQAFVALNDVLLYLQRATQQGTAFVFGYLGGAPSPFLESGAGTSFVLVFRALPLVLVVSALSALLFHWRVLPIIVRGFSWLLERTLGVGGAVGVSAAANVFVGMVESPLLVRPYLKTMSRGELFMAMACGMATIAGTVMALYASILGNTVPDALAQLLAASLVSVPGALVVAALMVPSTGTPTGGTLASPIQASSSMDAITQGTLKGLELLLAIVAMLIVLVALVGLANLLLGLFPGAWGSPLTLQRIFGWVLSPVAWLMGVPWSEATTAGALLGTKTVLNELIAYTDLAHLADAELSPRSRLIMTYALCGFANFGSLGIMIGGMGAMAPERRSEIVALGMKSIVAGTLATCLTGAIVGVIQG